MVEKAWEEFETYGIEYHYKGATWVLHIEAQSARDAMARLQRAAASGKVIGELQMVIPAAPGAGLLARLVCWWKNYRSSTTNYRGKS